MSTLITLAEAAVPSLIVAVIGYRASTRAARISTTAEEQAASVASAATRSSVEAEAYQRARGIYESALNQLQEQADRLQEQAEKLQERLDRVNEQLRVEREQSDQLRTQVRDLQVQVQENDDLVVTLNKTITVLQRQLAMSGVDAASVVHRLDQEAGPGSSSE
jgi:chromosome segregation ATPase